MCIRDRGNTGHTVSTFISPLRSSIHKLYIIQRTDFYTFPAADTAVIHIKFICMHKQWIKQQIYGAAAHSSKHTDRFFCKRISCKYLLFNLPDLRLRICNDIFCLFL